MRSLTLLLLLSLGCTASMSIEPPEGVRLTHTVCNVAQQLECEGDLYCLDPFTLEPLVDQLGLPVVPACTEDGTPGCWGMLTDFDEGFVHTGAIFVWCAQ